VFQLSEQEVEHAADRGVGAAGLIEHRLEFDGFDPLLIEQNLELPVEEPAARREKCRHLFSALSTRSAKFLILKNGAHRCARCLPRFAAPRRASRVLPN